MPPDRVVERIGLERRLEKSRQRLEGVAIPPRPVKVNLAFQGRPVADGDGMEANFAGKTAATFADYTALEVAGDTSQLYDTGGIPRRGLGQQRISGVTKGSFGFEIELLPPTGAEERQEHTDNPTERAVTALQDLLEASPGRNRRRTRNTEGSDAPEGIPEGNRAYRIVENQPDPDGHRIQRPGGGPQKPRRS